MSRPSDVYSRPVSASGVIPAATVNASGMHTSDQCPGKYFPHFHGRCGIKCLIPVRRPNPEIAAQTHRVGLVRDGSGAGNVRRTPNPCPGWASVHYHTPEGCVVLATAAAARNLPASEPVAWPDIDPFVAIDCLYKFASKIAAGGEDRAELQRQQAELQRHQIELLRHQAEVRSQRNELAAGLARVCEREKMAEANYARSMESRSAAARFHFESLQHFTRLCAAAPGSIPPNELLPPIPLPSPPLLPSPSPSPSPSLSLSLSLSLSQPASPQLIFEDEPAKHKSDSTDIEPAAKRPALG
jgi:hypothetical protein